MQRCERTTGVGRVQVGMTRRGSATLPASGDSLRASKISRVGPTRGGAHGGWWSFCAQRPSVAAFALPRPPKPSGQSTLVWTEVVRVLHHAHYRVSMLREPASTHGAKAPPWRTSGVQKKQSMLIQRPDVRPRRVLLSLHQNLSPFAGVLRLPRSPANHTLCRVARSTISPRHTAGAASVLTAFPGPSVRRLPLGRPA